MGRSGSFWEKGLSGGQVPMRSAPGAKSCSTFARSQLKYGNHQRPYFRVLTYSVESVLGLLWLSLDKVDPPRGSQMSLGIQPLTYDYVLANSE